MIRTAEWLAISIMGLVILFIFISISFFNFLIGPNYSGPRTTVEPSSAFFQIIFISIAPAIALSFFSNAISESSKLSCLLVVFSGVSLILGMVFVSNLIPQVDDIELPNWILYVPSIFVIIGIMLISIGIISYKKMRRRIDNNYAD